MLEARPQRLVERPRDRDLPLHCYRDAIRQLPEDLRDYSSASDDIEAALQVQIAKRNVRIPQISPSGSSSSSGNGSSTEKQATKTPEGTLRAADGADLPSRSAYRKAIDNLGTSNADAVPIPLLVLASLGAFLLSGRRARRHEAGARDPRLAAPRAAARLASAADSARHDGSASASSIAASNERPRPRCLARSSSSPPAPSTFPT